MRDLKLLLRFAVTPTCPDRGGIFRPIFVFGTLLCFVIASCQQPGASAEEQETEPQTESGPQLAEIEGLATVELIKLLAHPNELTRVRAHQRLHRFLVVETEHADYADRLTRFQKYAPHACKANHEPQTLHILGLFAAQQDISSILVKQCLDSPHARVRATALELAHFSDNAIDEELLAFQPDRSTLASYKIALHKLGTPEAARRLAEIE